MPATARTPFCIACGYPLDPARSTTCTECGRTFNPADPRTTDPTRFATRNRRRRRVLAVLVALALALLAVLPRGVVISSMTITTPAGVRRIVATTHTVPPRHMRFANAVYPGWTTTTDAGITPTGNEDGYGVNVTVAMRDLSWQGLSPATNRLAGSMSASPGVWPVVNGVPVTLEQAPRITRSLAAMLTQGESYGIAMTVSTTRPEPSTAPSASFTNPASPPGK